MGESKRRKQLDPSYGKTPRTKTIQNQKSRSFNLKPDYGEFWYKNCGEKEISIYIENPFVMITHVEGYINFELDTHMGTIITSSAIAMKYREKAFAGVIKPSPNERYLTEQTKEWVLPFRIVKVIN